MKKNIIWIFLAYSALFISVSCLKYARFLYFDFDLTIAELTLRNLAHGNLVSDSYGMAAILSSGHMPLINFFFLPFYLVFPSALTLLFLQTIFLGSGVFAVYLIAREVVGEEWSVYPPIIYALYPALQYINLYEIHYVSFSIPLLLFTFYFYLKRRFVPFFIFMALSLFCREEVLLVLAGMVVYMLARSRMDKRPIPLKWMAAIVSLSAVFIIIFLLLFARPESIGKAMPDPSKFSSAYLFAYAWLADSHTPYAIISHVFSAHNLKYILGLMLPLAFICLLDISFIMAVFGVAHVLLSGWPLHANIHFQHSSIAIPFLFISFIFGFKNILSMKMEENRKKALLVFLFCVCLLSELFIGPMPRILSGKETGAGEPPAYIKMKEYIVDQAPRGEPLIATFAFSSHLADRQALAPFYVFTYDKNLDYIPQLENKYTAAVIDFDDQLTFHSLFYTAGNGLLSRSFFTRESWGLAETIDNMAVYRKGSPGVFELVKSLGVKEELLDGSGDDLRVLRSEFRRSAVSKFPVLETSFDVIRNRYNGTDYIPILKIVNKSGDNFIFQYLAAYRLYPFREWRKGEVVRLRAKVFIPREFRGDGAQISLSFLKITNKEPLTAAR